MAKPFNVETEESRFRLPLQTREQIKALMLDLNLSATDVIVCAVAALWQRECGDPERDVFAEMDDVRETLRAYKIRLDMLEDGAE